MSKNPGGLIKKIRRRFPAARGCTPPLRARWLTDLTQWGLLVICFGFLLGLTSCYGVTPRPTPPEAQPEFKLETQMTKDQFAQAAKVQQMSEAVSDEYRLGPGDVLKFKAWHRPEISNDNIVVSPDGYISIIRLGLIKVEDKTLAEVTREITDKLSVLYEKPEINISIETYNNNKVFVLGRVTKPGVVNLPGPGTLLEALAMAGGLPAVQKDAFLTRCSIIRGKDRVIWIDLQELLHKGNMRLNARLQNKDIVFIPEGEDQLIYVMGEVASPGAFKLRAQFTYLDAVMLAGGPTKEANLTKTYVLRFDSQTKQGTVKQIDLKKMLETGLFTENFVLEDNDVVYVAPRSMAKFNYAMNQILPALAVLNLAAGTVTSVRSVFQPVGGISGSGGVAVSPSAPSK
jgi:polysaccharide biosynthesis/export protein